MDKVFFYRICRRCEKRSKFISLASFKLVERKNLPYCKYCKLIPDECIDSFRQSKYEIICPTCGISRTYKNRSYFLGISNDTERQCKWCSNISNIEQRKKEEMEMWKPIIGYWNLKYKTLRMIKDHWETLTQEEKNQILSKTPLQKEYYWGHLRRKNRIEGHRKCRQVMAEKYSGENHWMKRPEVLAKIRKTCEKYRGNGHWFRRNKWEN